MELQYCEKCISMTNHDERSGQCLRCKSIQSKFEPKPDERSEELLPANSGCKRPEKLILSEKDKHRLGTDAELEKSCMGDFVDLNIDREDHYNQAYISFSIDREMAMKIVKYLQDYYEI